MAATDLVSRALRMDRREMAFRAGASIRQLAQRASLTVRTPRWEKPARAVLSPDFDPARLADHFRTRPARFPLHPSERLSLRSQLLSRFPGLDERAAQQAAAIRDGRLNILGYRAVAVGSPIDWHRDPVNGRTAPPMFWASVPYLDPAVGDHKVIWEINRQQHWLTLGRAAWLTGDAGHADEIIEQFRGWLSQNPPLTGINWASMLELAFRSLSWLWAIQFCLAFDSDGEEKPPAAWLPDLLVALDAQLEHVRQNLSYYFSPNTHLLGEALALYVAGRALPELKRSARWSDVGRRVLVDELARQVHGDGGHAELSPHYHRYTLDFYLMALTMARLTGDAAAEVPFADAARRLARYARAMADDNGRLPLIGDDDGGQLFPIAEREAADATPSLAWAAVLLDDPALAIDPLDIPEEVCWLTGRVPELAAPPREPRPAAITVFEETGYAVARNARGDHAVLDGGRHGFLNGGHAHADALSAVLTLGGRPLLIDPGTATYTMNPAVRDLLRRTASHNTLLLDGREQAEPGGPFHWRSTASATFRGWGRAPVGSWVAAEHGAYAPCVHRRVFFLGDEGIAVVVDIVEQNAHGVVEHTAEQRWHLAPAWEYQAAAHGARLIHSDGTEVRLATTADVRAVRGAADGGWCAPVYGQLVPTWTLIAGRRAPAPLELVTVFSEGSVPPSLKVSISISSRGRQLTVEVERDGRRTALDIAAADGATHARAVASTVHAGAR